MIDIEATIDKFECLMKERAEDTQEKELDSETAEMIAAKEGKKDTVMKAKEGIFQKLYYKFKVAVERAVEGKGIRWAISAERS